MPNAIRFTGALLIVCCLVRPSAGQMGHARHPMVSSQRFVLDVRVGDDPEIAGTRTAIALETPTVPTHLTQRIALPGQDQSVVVRQYLPSAKLQQEVTPDESPDARAMVQLLIDGPSQRYERWLVDGDPERNRLISLIGTWRFMVAANTEQRDRLFEEFKTELQRKPRIKISAADGSAAIEVPCIPGTTHELAPLGGTVTIKEFFTHYALSAKSNQPINVSDKRVNPGALIELTQGKLKEQRWIFSQFPDYTGGHERVISWKTTLDCPSEGKSGRPDMLILMTRQGAWETWVRHDGKTRVHPGDSTVGVPGTQYTFRLTRTVPGGRLVESYQETESPAGVPVMRVETTGTGDQVQSVWLTPGKPRIILTEHGPVTLALHVDGVASGGHP